VKKARGAIKSFVELSPKEAVVKRDGEEIVLPADRLRIGDTVIVRPGERIPIDGVVEGGGSYVDESAVTGEPIAVSKTAGKSVFAGTINQQGSLTVRVTHMAKDTTLARIIHSIEEAQAKKSNYQLFGERFSRIYTPVMFAFGVAVAIVPPLAFGGDWQSWIYRALVVFVVSCSCGIALSVPVAIVAAVGNAARHGILLKGGLFLEKTQSIKVVAFDKTGTLTIGRPTVTRIVPAAGVREAHLLSLAASIESLSEHPLGQAIVRRAKEMDVYRERAVRDFEALPGRGARAAVDGEALLIGNAEFLSDNEVAVGPIEETVRSLEADGHSTVILAGAGRPLGVFGIADVVKMESRSSVRELRAQGLDVVMLTGDTEGTASAIAKSAEIDEYLAGLMPQDKIDQVVALRNARGPVMMVGDGINDSPAMATSDVGVAMGAAGTDVAMETGYIVLLADDLSRVPWLVRLSRRTVANIRQNIILSLLVIALLVPAALFGEISLLTGLVINEGAAILVILNALRLIK
ncbi:MAG: cation-translocating P-type ATPase, partial [Candidatus Krumholzibacteria bacterium]|nr:cation-translocating P-type ATPase [Candidatus Krumholzibacteria bacterium]